MGNAQELRRRFGELWNEERIDDIGDVFYATDALILPPDQEPIRGRGRIVDFFKELRKVAGDIDLGVIEAVTDGGLAYIAGTFAFPLVGAQGLTLETYRLGGDGTWKCVTDMWHSSQHQ